MAFFQLIARRNPFGVAAWKRRFPKFRAFLHKFKEVRYTSVPLWRPWRDF